MKDRRLAERVVAVIAGILFVGAVVGAIEGQGSDGGPAASPTGTAVEIRDFQFAPDELRVAVGDTVTWTNEDGFVHTVKGVEEVPARSEDLAEGDSYEFTFTDAGTFEYVCTIHASMRSTVVVGEAAT